MYFICKFFPALHLDDDRGQFGVGRAVPHHLAAGPAQIRPCALLVQSGKRTKQATEAGDHHRGTEVELARHIEYLSSTISTLILYVLPSIAQLFIPSTGVILRCLLILLLRRAQRAAVHGLFGPGVHQHDRLLLPLLIPPS